MKIAIDYNAAIRQIAGIGRYTRELIDAYLRLSDVAASDDELVLFYAARDLPPEHPGLARLAELQRSFPKVRTAPIPLAERWLTIAWQRARLPLPVERWTGPVDLVHAPDFVLPPVRRAPTLLTVHDLTFLVHPETAHANLRRYLQRAVPRSLARASHVLADSVSTQRDLERLLGVSPRKVSVLYPGVDPRFRRVEDVALLDAVRTRFQLPSRFLFFMGTLEPRKNLVRLFEAFYRVRTQPAFNDVELVLGGKAGWLSEPILEHARHTPGVRLLGPLDDADLPVLYTLASACVYPSLYEGFGFPPLEALACGTPVLTSNTSSLPEVVGDTALLVPPHDVDAIVVGIARLLTEPDLRTVARRYGPTQAARFNWQAAARQLHATYRAVLADRR